MFPHNENCIITTVCKLFFQMVCNYLQAHEYFLQANESENWIRERQKNLDRKVGLQWPKNIDALIVSYSKLLNQTHFLHSAATTQVLEAYRSCIAIMLQFFGLPYNIL